MTIDPATIEEITRLLGRSPRGLRAVAVTGPAGEPRVIRVASMVDDKPFPTLFWLIDPDLCYRIDCEEARGLIKEFQGRVDRSPALQRAMAADHRAHIALREACLDRPLRERLQEQGLLPVLRARGIGGIADFGRIRCLHTWYAAHLVVPNTVGELLDSHWSDPLT
jgi:uncharacterized protein